MDDELYHYGIKGMKWGIRRTPAQLGHDTSPKKRKSGGAIDAVKSTAKKAGKAISDRHAANKQKKAAEKEREQQIETQKKRRKKPLSEMTDDELKTELARLELEKRYKDTLSALEPKKVNKGKSFVGRVLEKSAENVASQFTTYVLGTAVNKAFKDVFDDPRIVNPKKGQKDK